MKDKIAAYDAQGFKAVRIASILGVSASYISQVQAEQDYPTLLKEWKERIKIAKEEEEREKSYIRLEDKVIAQVEESLPFAEFRDLTQMMQLLLNKKQKLSPTPGSIIHNTQNNVTFLSLPTSVLPAEIVLNAQKEILAVGDKTLAPMPSSGVRSLFDKISKRRHALTFEQLPDIDFTKLTEFPEDF